MNEIEKMYENANIEKEVIGGCYDYYSKLGIDIWKENNCREKNCDTCKKDKSIKRYPPFTTGKQIELIKWLAKIGIKIDKVNDKFTFSIFGIISNFSSFEESLANLINNIWKDLTEEEKQQIKEMLE